MLWGFVWCCLPSNKFYTPYSLMFSMFCGWFCNHHTLLLILKTLIKHLRFPIHLPIPLKNRSASACLIISFEFRLASRHYKLPWALILFPFQRVASVGLQGNGQFVFTFHMCRCFHNIPNIIQN